MRLEDMGVVRVCQSILEAAMEEGVRMSHEVLVQRIVRTYEETQGVTLSPATAACLLPGAGNTPWIAS